MKILYLDGSAGISGDMFAGALLDLGLDREALVSSLQSLPFEGYSLHIADTLKHGIRGLRFEVRLDEHHHHDHDHHHHGHDHKHSHAHAHEHRSMADIRAMIMQSGLSSYAKETTLSIFEKIACAEGKVHGKPAEEVHFHEVGAVDSLVDIISAALLVEQLRPDRVEVSVLREGTGFVQCAHGRMPVPAPATLEILRACGASLQSTQVSGEMITPTGAGIVAALGQSFGKPCPEGKILRVGYGAGRKDFEHPNLLRAVLVETEEAGSKGRDTICILTTVIDDCDGESLGFAMERLYEQGAREVYFTPAQTKKSRPAVELTVLCTEDTEQDMVRTLFAHTTTIGIRRSLCERWVMKRSTGTVSTEYGDIDVKHCVWENVSRTYPEYESVRAAALRAGVPIREVLRNLPCND